jgi:hypothetical protein
MRVNTCQVYYELAFDTHRAGEMRVFLRVVLNPLIRIMILSSIKSGL